MELYRCGFAGVLGQTNVGKSTFLNVVMGKELLITSAKPQTTRNRIRCIYTSGDMQIIFVDTPGLHRPHNRLSRHLLREAFRATRGLDILLYMVEPWGKVSKYDRILLAQLAERDCPMFLLVNKIDLARGNALEETLLAYAAIDRFAELIPISARKQENLQEVLRTICGYLPARAALFPPGINIDRSEEFLVGEAIREQIFRETYQEIPYETTVVVKWFHERADGLVEIKAEVIVDKVSHKGIILGKKGERIKRMGTRARAKIEYLLGAHVFLDLVVKVRRGWTKDEQQLTHWLGEEG